MQYLFTISTADFLLWPLSIPSNARVVTHESTGLCVYVKRRRSGLLTPNVIPSLQNHAQCLETFLSLKSIFALLRTKEQGMIDIYLNSAHITRHLSENGTLPLESDILTVLKTLHHYILYCPPLAQGLPKQVDPISFEYTPELKESKELFSIANQYYHYGEKEFSPLAPETSSQRVSLIYLPLFQPLLTAMSKIRVLLKSVKTQPTKGLPVHCILCIDSAASTVDTRLLTPETLTRMEILHISPRQYDDWCSHNQSRSSVTRRELLFFSRHDFRFCPCPEDYHWDCVVENITERSGIFKPLANWHFICINSSPLDFAYAHGVSDYAMKKLGNYNRLDITNHFHTWGRMDSLSVRISPCFKSSFQITTKEMVHTHEKNIERRVRHLGIDTFMASIGFMYESKNKNWSSTSYNRQALHNNSVISSEHVEKCFSGFALDSVKKLLENKTPCPICDDEATRVLETCGHVYCKQCLDTMFDTSGLLGEHCPECRMQFFRENIFEIKASKPQRKRASKEHAFARQTALLNIIPPQKGLMQEDLDYILIITPVDASLDTLQEWVPGVHIVTLETLGLRTPKSPKFSKLIMVSPFIPGILGLEKLHEILQSWTTPVFEFHTIVLQNGSQSEDAEIISSLAKCYTSVT